jgi:hypothetical protein
VDHRNGNLEPHAVRQDPFLTQGAEHEIRIDRVARIAQPRARIAEPHPLDAGLDPELPGIVATARQQLLDAIDRLRSPDGVEVEMAVENLIAEPVHPGAAFADFAIRHRRKKAAQRTAERAHYLFDAVERHTAHKQKSIAHFITGPFNHDSQI